MQKNYDYINVLISEDIEPQGSMVLTSFPIKLMKKISTISVGLTSMKHHITRLSKYTKSQNKLL